MPWFRVPRGAGPHGPRDRAPSPFSLKKHDRSFKSPVVGRGETTRQRILDHAMAVASAEGFDGLTIGRLSADLKLSKSGLFAHFGSKEALQEALLELTADRFVDAVIRPAITANPRGLPRLRAAFENWLEWGRAPDLPGGCLLIAAGFEFDDRPGLVRDLLVRYQRDLLATLARSVRLAAAEGHLAPDTDPDQAAFEIYGLILSFHHAYRLLQDAEADRRVRAAFERLLRSYGAAD